MNENKLNKLYEAIKDKRTILGVGPMSMQCIDAVIETANEYQIPMQLIASRRQVECSMFYGGYVSTTEELASYVLHRDTGDFVLLARDHGGPWQGDNEGDLLHDVALQRALMSYRTDIASGFDILHLDPSLKSRSFEEIIQDVFFLHQRCLEIAQSLKKNIVFEIGTEEHGGHTTTLVNFTKFTNTIKALKNVKFVVGNMGMYVKEIFNIGRFDEVQTRKLIAVCNDNNMFLKGHNCDYAPMETIQKKNQLGVHAINIAPELGYLQTHFIMENLKESELNEFVDICYKSKKWKKWMIDPNLSYSEKYYAKICGHYLFNHPRVKEILNNKSKDFHLECKNILKSRIEKYLKNLGWPQVM